MDRIDDKAPLLLRSELYFGTNLSSSPVTKLKFSLTDIKHKEAEDVMSQPKLIEFLPRNPSLRREALLRFHSIVEDENLVNTDNDRFDPSVGQVIVTEPISPWTISEETWNYNPPPQEINRGNLRFIFCNVELPERDIKCANEVEMMMRRDARFKEVECTKSLEWIRKYYVRALYSTGWDIAATLELLWAHFEFRRASPELPVRDTDIMSDLKEAGACYFHGRDFGMRPLMFIRLEGTDALDRSTDRALRLLTFCAEYFLRYLTIAGKFENWIIIFDCGGRGLMKTNPSFITTVMGTMHNRYKGRVYRIYITNFPRWFGWLTNWVMSVIPANSAHKLRFCATDWPERLREIAAPHQLEQRYGGSQPDLKPGEFYPFKFFPGPHDPKTKAEDIQLQSKSNLHELLDNDLLTGSPFNIDVPKSTET